MKRIACYVLLISTVLVSCDTVSQKTKETINKGGETVGKTASEFIEGVTEGVEQTLQCEINLSEELKSKGLATGKYSLNSIANGLDNQLTLYIIFNEAFSGNLIAKALDKNGLEIGRSQISVSQKAGEAAYFDFNFDPRTNIEVRSKIAIEAI